jgi:hypothetical protein
VPNSGSRIDFFFRSAVFNYPITKLLNYQICLLNYQIHLTKIFTHKGHEGSRSQTGELILFRGWAKFRLSRSRWLIRSFAPLFAITHLPNYSITKSVYSITQLPNLFTQLPNYQIHPITIFFAFLCVPSCPLWLCLIFLLFPRSAAEAKPPACFSTAA